MRCATCGEANAADARFCKGCGQGLVGAAEAPTGLSWRWVGLGVLYMFGTNIGLGFLLGLVLGAAGVALTTGIAVAAGLFAFGLGGYLTGKKSPGKTIVEPGLAAFIAAALSVIVQGGADVTTILVGGALPFLAGLAGGWLGEKAQGTV